METKHALMKNLLFYTDGYRHHFAAGFLMILLELALSFFTPLILSVTIDSVLGDMPLNAPWYFSWIISMLGGIQNIRNHYILMPLLMVILAALSGMISFLRPYAIWSAVCQITKNLRDRYYTHVQRLPYAFHASAKTGDLIQRATSDVDTVSKFLYNNILEIFRTAFLLIVGFIIMSAMSVPITLACFGVIPVILLVSMKFVRKIDVEWENVEKMDSRSYTVIQENLTGVRVVRAFGRQRFERDKFYEANEANRGAKLGFYRQLTRLWLSLDLLSGLQLSLVTILGVILTVHGSITIGQFTALASYAAIFLSPIQDLGKHLSAISQARIAASRIEEIMDIPEEDPVVMGVRPDLKGDIVFDHVCFSYGDAPVIQDLSMTIPAGSTIAILGGTGSGKTTLISLLQRLYDPQSGRITIGGTDITQIQKHHLRDRIGMVMQEPFLYSRSIRDNIGIKSHEKDQETIEKAAKIASVHEDISEFREGYDTILGERGVTLSGGQKQRVAIARAIMEDCDILVFDDALSAVDTRTDHAIREALKQRKDGVTTIIISHRISTLKEADQIFVLNGGQIAECGTHEELLLSGGIYKTVYDIQSGCNA